MNEPISSSQLPHDFLNDVVAVESIAAVPTILDVVCRTTGMGFAAIARVTASRSSGVSPQRPRCGKRPSPTKVATSTFQ